MADVFGSVGNAVKSVQKVLDKQINNDSQAVSSGMSTSSKQIARPADSPSNAYRVQFISNDLDVTVVGFLPENINVSLNSSYGTPFEQLNVANLAGGAIGGELGQAIASIGGMTGMLQAMTIQVWQGSSGLDMSIPLVLTANDDPSEITQAIMNLYKLSAPSAPGGLFSLMVPPGPSFKALDKLKAIAASAGREVAEAVTGGAGGENNFIEDVKNTLAEGMRNQISVTIGNYLYFPSVVVKGIDTNFTNYLSPDASGNRPWKAEVTVQFSTLWNPSVEDMHTIFKMPLPPPKA